MRDCLLREGKAVTLIEILAVIIMVAIMAAVVIPHYSIGYTSKRRMRDAVQRIVSDIRYTRRLAITDIDANKYIIKFYFSDNTYGIYRNKISSNNRIGELKKIPPEIVPSGQQRYVFFQLGNADYNGSGSLLLTGPRYTYLIKVIKATGRVTMTEKQIWQLKKVEKALPLLKF